MWISEILTYQPTAEQIAGIEKHDKERMEIVELIRKKYEEKKIEKLKPKKKK